MSLEHYLIDHSRKEIFELGGSIWAELKDEMEYLLYFDGFQQFFQEHVFKDRPNLTADIKTYWLELGAEVWKFASQTKNPNQLEIITDGADELFDLRCRGYEYASAKYTNEMKEYTFLLPKKS